MMRKLVLLTLAMWCLFISQTAAFAGASNVKQHRNWASYVFSMDDGSLITGMMATGVDDPEKSTLIMTFSPPQCMTGNPVIIVCGQDTGKSDARPGRASIRVDNREICEADVNFTYSNGCVTAAIEKIYNGNLLNDAIRGNTVRFKLELQGTAPVIKKYSLIGFTDSLSRAFKMCTGIKAQPSKPKTDEDFFRPNEPRAPAPATPVRQRSDEDYFL